MRLCDFMSDNNNINNYDRRVANYYDINILLV